MLHLPGNSAEKHLPELSQIIESLQDVSDLGMAFAPVPRQAAVSNSNVFNQKFSRRYSQAQHGSLTHKNIFQSRICKFSQENVIRIQKS